MMPGERRPPSFRRTPGQLPEERVVDVPRDHPVQHGDVDELPAPAPLACGERGEDADRGHERAATDVGDLHPGDDGRAARLADVVQHAGVAEIVDVVAHPVAVGSVLPVARDRAVDEARVRGRERRVVDAEARGDARPEALEDDVGAGAEAAEDVAPRLALQVERHAPLVARQERDAGAERIVRRGHHQHVHPQVGEQRGAERPRKLPREVEQLQVPEGGTRHQ